MKPPLRPRLLSSRRLIPPVDVSSHEVVAALPQVLKIIGAIVAPTTMLTALLFYFGRLHITGLFRYLGVNFTVLDLTVHDYLIRSVDGLFVPLTVVATAALLAIWAHRLLLGLRPVETRPALLRILAALAGISGLALVSLAIAEIIGDATLFTAHPETGGLSLAVGVVLLAYAFSLLRLLIAERSPERVQLNRSEAVIVVEWAAIFVLVSVGLFWAVGSYAIGVGAGRGHQIETELSLLPDVVLYSEKSLSLEESGIREVACRNPDAAYRFRYEGLKLVLQSGDQYLFLPASWTRANGTALLIPRSETLRLEFSRAGHARKGSC